MENIERALNFIAKANLVGRVANCRKNKGIYPFALAFAEDPSHIRRKALFLQNSAALSVVNVVVDIGDSVGKFDNSSLKGVCLFSARMAKYSVADFIGKVQPSALFLNHVNNPKALFKMSESALRYRIERALPCVAERSVAKVVTESNSFGQILIQRKTDGNRPRNLRNLKGMGEAGPVMVAVRRKENLRLMLEPPKGTAMYDSVSVALKGGSDGAFLLRARSALSVFAKAGIF